MLTKEGCRSRQQRLCARLAELDIDAGGELAGSTFRRALVRSCTRLTYDALENAVQSGVNLPGIEHRHIEALYGAFRLLRAARRKRGALDLQSVEPAVTIDPTTGDVSRFTTTRQLDSHRLIEEFMVLANTAVARRLMQRKIPFLYRVHDSPRASRIRALQDDLRALTGRSRALSGSISGRRLNDLLERAYGRHNEESVHLAVLRAQSQAEYSPDNIGHFGLGLRHYAHFTSPIRRYSDLTVHRALLHTLGLEPRPTLERDELWALAGDLSSTERRSTAAEREACQRYASRYLQRVSAPRMPGRIVAVERFGAFVRLDESGIEGLLPMAGLGRGYFRFDARARQISRQATGETFGPGDAVTVQLADVDPVRGRVAFRRVN
jgi:ribonuclease R